MSARSAADGVKIRIEHLAFGYAGAGSVPATIIEDLSLDIREHEFLAIVGASGCGKTTLLNVIAGLLPLSRGTARIDGRDITGPGPDRTVVFQDDAVFPWYTVLGNVEYGLRVAGLDAAERKARAARSIALVGLTGNEGSYPRQLSGGMRKRVDVARAIATRPEVLMMDEPFAALDVMTKANLQEQFLRIWNETRMTVVFVTHDLEEALFMADRVVVMASRPGRIARIVDVPFARPRERDLKTDPAFQAMRRELGHVLDANGGHGA